MEEHLRALLADALGYPVAFGNLGDGAALPRIALWRIAGRRSPRHDGLGLMRGRLQADVYADTHWRVLQAERQVRDVLERYSGGPVELIELEGVADMTGDDAGILARVRLTFSMTYRD